MGPVHHVHWPVGFPNGVYVDLPELIYFRLDRLGSTDLVKLLRGPADWWYGSRHNPDHTDPGSPERDFGKALHTIVLEGEARFRETFVQSPFEDFRTKEARIWRDQVLAEGRSIVTEDQIRRVVHMAQLIVNHPQFSEPLASGLSEVSILFDLHGQPMRARFDKLLPRFVVDLKTYGAHIRGRDHHDKALRIIAERDYDVQRYVYDRAREALIHLVKADLVFGAQPGQLEWLRQVAELEDWAWVWIFYQRRDDAAGKAPIVQPIERLRFDVTFDTGRRKAETALANYKRFVGKFGLDVPWAVVEPMWRPADHEFPPWLGDFVPAPDNDNHLEQENAA